MALLVDSTSNSSSNYPQINIPVTGELAIHPLSVAHWTLQTDNVILAGIAFRTATSFGPATYCNSANGYVIEEYDGTNDPIAKVGTAVVGSWQLWGGVFNSLSSRTVYHPDGSSVTESATTVTVNNLLSRVKICDYAHNAGTAIAEVAAWSCELAPSDYAAMRQGKNPSAIQPNNLLFYFPLRGDLRDYGPRALPIVGRGTWDRSTAKYTGHPPVEPRSRLHRMLRGAAVPPSNPRPRITMVM
jgi:hypothetical protein